MDRISAIQRSRIGSRRCAGLGRSGTHLDDAHPRRPVPDTEKSTAVLCRVLGRPHITTHESVVERREVHQHGDSYGHEAERYGLVSPCQWYRSYSLTNRTAIVIQYLHTIVRRRMRRYKRKRLRG